MKRSVVVIDHTPTTPITEVRKARRALARYCVVWAYSPEYGDMLIDGARIKHGQLEAHSEDFGWVPVEDFEIE